MHSHNHISQEFVSNSAMSNEHMINQKYESINCHQFPCECPTSHGILGAFDNSVDKYLNFGEDAHGMIENYDHIHPVKQEELDFPNVLPLKHCSSFEQYMPYDQNYQQLFQKSTIEANPQSFMEFQQLPTQAVQNNTELSTKMKRIMKREKAKSRRKLNADLPSVQQNQVEIDTKVQLENKNEVLEQEKTFAGYFNPQDQIKMETNPYSEDSLLDDNLNQFQQQQSSSMAAPGETKQQKKVLQMIRNRISAQNSRDRKKAYISKLEAEKDDILLEGIEQRKVLSQTQSQLQQERNKNASLQQELSELKKKLSNCKCIDDVHNYTANPIHKSYAAFKVAFFAVLGVVLIFNSKPSKESQAIINQSSQMMKMLDDLQKQTEDFAKIDGEKQQDKEARSKSQTIDIEMLHSGKQFSKEESNHGSQSEEDSCHSSLQGEYHNKDQHSSSLTQFMNHEFAEEHQDSDQIKKDQWIQFVVPKPNHGNSQNRDDLSRDSAETDDMSNSGQSQKYIQVWAQIKSVNEFEQEN